MRKKIIVLFLMVISSVILLPSESKAAEINEANNVVNATAPSANPVLQQNRRRNRRWRNMRWRARHNNRWNNRRDRRHERRDNRRNRWRNRRN